jgi:protein phosphatase/serine/threonine-protein phosphatase Stp1
MTKLKSWGVSHPGSVRKHNEDDMLARADLGLWAVADGAGGHESGELASGMIVEALQLLPQFLSAADVLTQMRQALSQVHDTLRTEAQSRGRGGVIASTFVALILRDGRYTCLWAGDSRAYLLRAGMLTQLSRDHSLVQELVDTGKLAAEDAEHHPHANVITRAVGADDRLELDKVTGLIEDGDIFLLCSDGLSKVLTLEQIAGLLNSADGQDPAQALVAAALAAHARDNVTAMVVSAAH